MFDASLHGSNMEQRNDFIPQQAYIRLVQQHWRGNHSPITTQNQASHTVPVVPSTASFRKLTRIGTVKSPSFTAAGRQLPPQEGNCIYPRKRGTILHLGQSCLFSEYRPFCIVLHSIRPNVSTRILMEGWRVPGGLLRNRTSILSSALHSLVQGCSHS